MPLFLCRWPNGDCSAVLAQNEQAAIIKLDELANPEGCPLIPIQEFQVHFHLTDDGQLELETFGEETESEVWDFCYPVLEEVQMQVAEERDASGAGEFTQDQTERVRAAVRRERDRVTPMAVKEPETELGRNIKKQMGAPTVLVDQIVRQEGEDTLRKLKTPRKPH